MKHLLRWIVGIISVIITVYIVKALHLTLSWHDTWGMVVFVPVLALVNIFIGSILRLFAAPITCLTLGLFGFVINAIVFWIAAKATNAHVNFVSALVGSILYSVISIPLSGLIKEHS